MACTFVPFCIVVSLLLNLSHANLIWSDEFNEGSGTQPSGDKWRYELGDGSSRGIPGWGNNEKQYYTDLAENCAMDGQGNLVITALKGSRSYNCHYGPCTYTSARLASNFVRKYGRFEARIKTPSGKGIWPAFWMLGEDINTVSWPQCGEIDIMELRGSNPNQVAAAVHGPQYSGGNSLSNTFNVDSSQSFDNNFHVFAVNWREDEVTFYVDDTVVHSVRKDNIPSYGQWVFNKPFYMLLNLAIGGHFDGEANSDESFPKQLFIDYVRVYEN